jgi:uncharacterized protein (DUF2147 family)
MKTVWIALFFSVLTGGVFGQSGVLGKWKTIDDETGKPRSVVEIYEEGGKIHGKIVQLFRETNEDADPVCDKCEGDKANKRVLGMVIIESLRLSGTYYGNGTILDPKNGRVYSCKLWLQGGDLMVRGYWGPFYRTQTWKRYI